MNWQEILKRAGSFKKINIPLFREALGTATANLDTFTLPEILPLATELYKEYLLRDGIFTNDGGASRHATSVFKVRGRGAGFYGRIINNLGVHRSTTRRKKLPSGVIETIYEKVEE